VQFRLTNDVHEVAEYRRWPWEIQPPLQGGSGQQGKREGQPKRDEALPDSARARWIRR